MFRQSWPYCISNLPDCECMLLQCINLWHLFFDIFDKLRV
jgi:hypothetical protein